MVRCYQWPGNILSAFISPVGLQRNDERLIHFRKANLLTVTASTNLPDVKRRFYIAGKCVPYYFCLSWYPACSRDTDAADGRSRAAVSSSAHEDARVLH